jgi:hypothetical protein
MLLRNIVGVYAVIVMLVIVPVVVVAVAVVRSNEFVA